MGAHWGSWGTAGSGSSARFEDSRGGSLTLVSDDADTGYPAMEYTDGRIHLFDRHQNALVVEYIPNEAADAPPLDVRDWALILADDTGAVLASGVITQVRTDVGNIRRYQITPDQEGPAPPGHP